MSIQVFSPHHIFNQSLTTYLVNSWTNKITGELKTKLWEGLEINTKLILLVPTLILLRGNIWFFANCVIKLHQRERRLRLQRNQAKSTDGRHLVFRRKSISFTSRCNHEAQPWASIGHRGDASSIWHQVWVRHLWCSTNPHCGSISSQ